MVFDFSFAIYDGCFEESVVNLHVFRVESQLDLCKLMSVDHQIGRLGRENCVLVFIFHLDVDLALDLVGIDDFDALLDTIRILGHDQSAEIKQVFIFELS